MEDERENPYIYTEGYSKPSIIGGMRENMRYKEMIALLKASIPSNTELVIKALEDERTAEAYMWIVLGALLIGAIGFAVGARI